MLSTIETIFEIKQCLANGIWIRNFGIVNKCNGAHTPTLQTVAKIRQYWLQKPGNGLKKNNLELSGSISNIFRGISCWKNCTEKVKNWPEQKYSILNWVFKTLNSKQTFFILDNPYLIQHNYILLFNPLNASVALIEKRVNWFALLFVLIL